MFSRRVRNAPSPRTTHARRRAGILALTAGLLALLVLPGAVAACSVTTKLSGDGQGPSKTITVRMGATVTDQAYIDVYHQGGQIAYYWYTSLANCNAMTNGTAAGGGTQQSNKTVPASSPVTFANAGTYYWRAKFTWPSNNTVWSACDEIVTVTKASPSISTSLSGGGQSGTNITVPVGTVVTDQATLSGATADAGGTVTYTIFDDNDCSASDRYAGPFTVTVTNGVVPASSSVTLAKIDTFYWKAEYSGDAKNNGATSACTAEKATTTKYGPAISTSLSGDGQNGAKITVRVGSSVSDQATLSGASADAGGTVTYSVYDDNDCHSSDRIAGPFTVSVTNGSVPASSAVTLNSTGTYYWKVEYSGDSKNNGATSACTAEIATVTKYSPSISTTLTGGDASGATITVHVGTSVSDQAVLTNASPTAGGTVSYKVFSNSSCSALVRNAGTKTVSNGVVPPSDSVTFDNVGVYYWQASYSGDAKNAAVTSGCQEEIATVSKYTPSIVTSLSGDGQSGAHIQVALGSSVTDQATLSGASPDASGSITYSVFSDSACTVPFATGTAKSFTGGSVPASDAVTFPTAGTYYWKVAYSGDAKNAAATSGCQEETVTVAKRSVSISTSLSGGTASGPMITVLPGTSVTDQATLSGVTADAGGTVTYTAYSDAACMVAVPGGSSTKDVVNGVAGASDPVQLDAIGSYHWIASYSGDANNGSAVSGCSEEIATVSRSTVSISTALSSGDQSGADITVAIGASVTDQATLSGTTADAAGTVTYTVFSDPSCQVLFAQGGTKDVVNGTAGASDAVTFSNAGTYYWQASYSGDSKNDPATSSCQEETVTVGQNNPGIFSKLNGQAAHITVLIGTSVTDTAYLTGLASGGPVQVYGAELDASVVTMSGTVTFTVFRNAECSGEGIFAGTVPVVDGAATSDPVVLTETGTYYWQAYYSGDANNQPILHRCTEETATVGEPELTPSPEPSTPSFPPTPCELLGTCPTPTPTATPEPTPTPTATPEPTPTPTGEVNPATGTPEPQGDVLPQTTSDSTGTTGTPFPITLLALGLCALGLFLLSPIPARARR